MAAGRPITWTEAKKKAAIESIFNRIAAGESVRSILDNADRSEYPSWVTFNQWLSDNDELAKQYARTCELRADYIFDQMFDIADDGTNDYINKIQQGEATLVLNAEHIQRSRLRIDTRKWALSKMNPKKYGEQTKIEHSGEIKSSEPKINLIVEGKTFNLKEKDNEK